MKILKKTRLATAIMLCSPMLLAAGCGGSSSGSDDGDAVVSRGEITGFGSVYVNGRRYQTDRASFRVDDDDGVESDLRLGMIVTVRGSRDDDGYYADSIDYDNELKGPVSAIDIIDGSSKTLTILGQTVLVTLDTKIDDDGGLTYDMIALNDVLEVSGYIGDGQLIATHIELQDDDDEIEIKGVIENLGADSFEIRGFPVSYDDSTEIDDDIRELANGLYVEVEGQLDIAGTTLIAEEIEAEDDGFDDDENEVEIKGVISEYNGDTSRFTLQGLTVDASTAQLDPASLVLGDGLLVEVEGYIADGVLFADEVELEDDDDSSDDD
jgi:hypothetical protein